MRNPISILTLTVLLALTLAARAEDPPKSAAAEIDAGDKAALEAAANKDVVVVGTIKKAKWSNSGKVMTIEFADSPLIAAVFEKNKDAVNAAHGGDAAKKWTGAKVKLKGRLGKYGGQVKALQDHPQIVITKADQVTVVQAAPAAEGEKKE